MAAVKFFEIKAWSEGNLIIMGGNFFGFFSRWIIVLIPLLIKWQFKYKISEREFSIFRMKFMWYEEPRCSWGHFQLNEAMRQAGFSSKIPPAVACQSTVYRNLMGRLCKEGGACVALGEQGSIQQPDFPLCKWVVSQGARRRGTGEKQGRQALLAGGSWLQEWSFGHHTART